VWSDAKLNELHRRLNDETEDEKRDELEDEIEDELYDALVARVQYELHCSLLHPKPRR
jgi:predicted transcriptional regulator